MKVDVVTRIHYNESTDEKPHEIDCYVDFGIDKLNKVELGTKDSSRAFLVSEHHLQSLNVTKSDFENLRKECEF